MGLPKINRGWAALEAKSAELQPVEATLATPAQNQVLIEVSACGICHSDLHLVDNDWWISEYPLVPGHEIVGRVAAVGSAVRSLVVGDWVGVGWQHSSCGQCRDCHMGNENLCDSGDSTCLKRWGGFADYHLAEEKFCFPLPRGVNEPAIAPLFCGGATVYSPLEEFLPGRESKNSHVGVVGLGGLGHLAVKFAVAMGFEVTVFSSSESKKADALKLGAHHFVASRNTDQVSAIGRCLDLVITTVNVDLEWQSYLKTLRSDGTLCFVGIPPAPVQFSAVELLGKRLRVAGNPTASPSRIREMVEFCIRHKIRAEVETFPMAQVNQAISKVRSGQVRHRAVLVNGNVQ